LPGTTLRAGEIEAVTPALISRGAARVEDRRPLATQGTDDQPDLRSGSAAARRMPASGASIACVSVSAGDATIGECRTST